MPSRLDQSIPMLAKGYAWLPDLRAGRRSVRTRLMLARPTLGVEGTEGARFVYDERHVRRGGALPEPVSATLFGEGGVHHLDGEEHRVRKAMFVQLLMGDGVADLVDEVTAAWDAAVAGWARAGRVVLQDAAAEVLTAGVCTWAGVPVDPADLPSLARDLTTMVDGFATGSGRHWRARRARQRREGWLAGIVEQVRTGDLTPPPGSVLAVVAAHRDADGELLAPRIAAVEVINVIRPTVAVSWFVAFTAHALHRWPEHRDRLRTGDPAFATAFTHEVRRFYPFAPFIGGRAPKDVEFDGQRVPAGSMVLLDLWGTDHDPDLFPEPYAFRPERFLTAEDAVREIGPWELVPQGGGDPRTGHRCPGEDITVALLSALAVRLARLDYTLPEQDLTISLSRSPAKPASGVVMTGISARRAAADERGCSGASPPRRHRCTRGDHGNAVEVASHGRAGAVGGTAVARRHPQRDGDRVAVAEPLAGAHVLAHRQHVPALPGQQRGLPLGAADPHAHRDGPPAVAGLRGPDVVADVGGQRQPEERRGTPPLEQLGAERRVHAAAG